MPYHLLNACSHFHAQLGMQFIRGFLDKEEKKSHFIEDFWINPSREGRSQEQDDIIHRLNHAEVSVAEKMTIIIGHRENLLRDEILPKMDEGHIVIYHGGPLYDNMYVDIPFQKILEENLEMMQVVGGIAYPTSAMVVNPVRGDKDAVAGFRAKARVLAASMSRFKQLVLGPETELDLPFFEQA